MLVLVLVIIGSVRAIGRDVELNVRVCSFLDYNLLMILLCLVRMLRGWNKDLWCWKNGVQDGG